MHYCFNAFVLDTQNRTLFCNNQRLHCDERVILLLAQLIDAYPAHCDQACLLEHIWPNTVVSSWSVARLISDTRKLFESAGLKVPIIQTLHGRGYRLSPDIAAIIRSDAIANSFAAQDHSLAITDSATSAANSNTLQPAQKKTYFTLPGLVLIAILSSAVLALLFYNQIERSGPLVLAEPHNVKARILWVDDHPENNQAERQFLEQKKIGVYTTKTSSDALTLLSLYSYDAIITDMGRGSDPLAGLKLMQAIRDRGINTPIYLYTIMPSEALRQKAQEHGAQDIAVEAEDLYQHLMPLIRYADEGAQ